MDNYKKDAAQACLQFLKPQQVIGLGAGATVAYLVDYISEDTELAKSLVFVSSSFQTRSYLLKKQLNVTSAALLHKLDIYFDGCDQFDAGLNALKSGGGIHTSEKILAAMAHEFILMGDEGKFVPMLNNTYPLVIEVLPEALSYVLHRIKKNYPNAVITLRAGKGKDGAVISDNGNMLADVLFERLPEILALNADVNMIPGVVAHSLFFNMATKAVIAGETGIRMISPQR